MICKMITLFFVYNLVTYFTTITTCFLVSHELNEGLYTCLMMIKALFSSSNIVWINCWKNVRELCFYHLSVIILPLVVAIDIIRKIGFCDWCVQLNFSRKWYMTKILLVTKVKSHVTIIVKNKGYWMKKKFNNIWIHLLTPLYMYCYMQLKCDYFD
jgi:hypothetical protein